MKALRAPGDSAARVQEYLSETLPSLAIEPVVVTLGLPDDQWSPKSIPHIGIFDDGGASQWPVASSPLLRVTVWSNGRTRSRAVAGWVMGVLLARRIPGVANVREPSTLLDARDPKNKGLTASFTVRTTVRTSAL